MQDLTESQGKEGIRKVISPKLLKQYHIFLASPGDVNDEREHVRQFFKRYNQHTAHLWNVCFEVIDWENYSTIGVGRPHNCRPLHSS